VSGAPGGLAGDQAAPTDEMTHSKFAGEPVGPSAPLAVARANAVNSLDWRGELTTWGDVCRHVAEPDVRPAKDGPLWFFGELKGERKVKADVLCRSALVIDVEHGSTVDDAIAAMESTGLAHLIHTTHGSRPGDERFRVLVPLSRPVVPSEWAHVTRVLVDARYAGRHGIPQIPLEGVDPASWSVAQAMYEPATPYADDYRSWAAEGGVLDVERVLAANPMSEVSQDRASAEAAGLAPFSVQEAAKATAVLAKLCRELGNTPEGGGEHGGRNNALNAYAHQLFSWAYYYDWSDPETIEAELTEAAQDAGLEGGEAARTLASARQAAEGRAPVARPDVDQLDAVATVAGLGASSDARAPRSTGHRLMAEQIAERLGGRVIHTPGLGWLAWDGKRFQRDEALAKQVLTGVAVQVKVHAARTGDAVLTRAGLQWDSSGGVNGVMNLLASMPEVHTRADQLDADPYLLNVANGTLDLRTMELAPHRPGNRLTKVTRAACDPQALGRRWERFLAEVLPDEGVRAYLQRYVGQALYGGVQEHLLALLTGTGRNGKGVFYLALANALADYSVAAVPELLLDTGNRGGASPELMALRGARWVILSETGAGRALDEPTVKRLTGGDTIAARYLYGDLVEFTPSHTLAMVTNHLPRVRQSDVALWARMRVIDFPESFQGREDPGLGDALELEADAILAWVLAGWEAYQREGMGKEPEAVMAATRAYEQASDPVARFLDDECKEAPGARVAFGKLYEAWGRWAAAHGGPQARALSRKAFGDKLSELRYPSVKGAKGVAAREGLVLTNPFAEDELL